MPIGKGPFRIDLQIKNVEVIDKEKGLLRFEIELDPTRYEQFDLDGKKAWRDKGSKIVLLEEELIEGWMRSMEVPIVQSPPTIKDLTAYFQEAKPRVKQLLSEELKIERGIDLSENFLELNKDKTMVFAVLYIDLVGSTEMSRTLGAEKMNKIVTVLSHEITLLINGYRGYVLKYTGDGLIGYFPAERNFPGMIDNAGDCAIVAWMFMREVLIPALVEQGYPEIGFRIGVDCGENQIVELGSKDIKNSRDLLGYTMNVAAKICGIAKKNQVLVGRAVYSNLHHVTRQKFFVTLTLPNTWQYRDTLFGDIYGVYQLDERRIGRALPAS